MGDRLEQIRERVSFEAHRREDVPFLLEQVATWKAHAEADHATLERVAALVEEFRQAAAQADFVGFDSCWETAADRLAAALTEGGPADRD